MSLAEDTDAADPASKRQYVALRMAGGTKPDLVLLDIRMPDMSGVDVYGALSNVQQSIFKNGIQRTSGCCNDAERVDARTLGAS